MTAATVSFSVTTDTTYAIHLVVPDRASVWINDQIGVQGSPEALRAFAGQLAEAADKAAAARSRQQVNFA